MRSSVSKITIQIFTVHCSETVDPTVTTLGWNQLRQWCRTGKCRYSQAAVDKPAIHRSDRSIPTVALLANPITPSPQVLQCWYQTHSRRCRRRPIKALANTIMAIQVRCRILLQRRPTVAADDTGACINGSQWCNEAGPVEAQDVQV